MNTDDYIKKIEEENKELKEKLTKYTAPQRHKKYYANHKDVILAKNKEYQVTPEKKKEYAKKAYLNKKAKIKKEFEQTEKPNL